MRKLLATSICLCLTASVPAMAAKGARGAGVPARYSPQALDGDLAQVVNPVDGRSWSAWAYRNGAEYDLALSRSAGDGVWTEPLFFGLDDGADQIEPALAVDAHGTTYLAYVEAGNLVLRALRAYSSTWSAGVVVESDGGRFGAPILRVVADTLVVGCREGERVSLAVLPLLAPTVDSGASIYDGPDPITGMFGDQEDEEKKEEEDETASRNDPPISGVQLIPTFGGGSDTSKN